MFARSLILPVQPLECVFLDSAADGTDATTYTFSNLNFGRPHKNRLIVVSFHSEDSATNYSLSTATITPAGNSAITLTLLEGTADAAAQKAGIYAARVPAGWTGSVSLTFSEAITSCGVALHGIYGIPPDRFVVSNTGRAADVSMTPSGTRGPAIVLAAATVSVSGDNCVWTGVDETYDQDIGTEAGMSGGFKLLSSVANHTIQGDWTGTTVRQVAVIFSDKGITQFL